MVVKHARIYRQKESMKHIHTSRKMKPACTRYDNDMEVFCKAIKIRISVPGHVSEISFSNPILSAAFVFRSPSIIFIRYFTKILQWVFVSGNLNIMLRDYFQLVISETAKNRNCN